MNILDNLFLGSPVAGVRLPAPPPGGVPLTAAGYSFADMDAFMSFSDCDTLQRIIEHHWLAVASGSASIPPGYFDYQVDNPAHLIFAYLVENTGLFHTIREVLSQFFNSERISKAGVVAAGVNIQDLLYNTEQLFYRDWGGTSVTANISSVVRPSSSSARANAYHRLFNTRLHWDKKYSDKPVDVMSTEVFNATFVAKLERLLTLFWEHFINANNSSGANVSDPIGLQDAARDLRELLMARRSTSDHFVGRDYGQYSLSRVEYYAFVQAYWLYALIAPASPLAMYLKLDGVEHGAVLRQLGDRMQVPVHSKSSALFEMAAPLGSVLRRIEQGYYDDPVVPGAPAPAWMPGPPVALADVARAASPTGNPAFLNDLATFLTIVNNWETTTGSDIKADRTRVKRVP